VDEDLERFVRRQAAREERAHADVIGLVARVARRPVRVREHVDADRLGGPVVLEQLAQTHADVRHELLDRRLHRRDPLRVRLAVDGPRLLAIGGRGGGEDERELLVEPGRIELVGGPRVAERPVDIVRLVQEALA